MDWWTPAQTHASLSAPSQYPGETRGDRRRQRWHKDNVLTINLSDQQAFSVVEQAGGDTLRHT